jgi:hypothetical protein
MRAAALLHYFMYAVFYAVLYAVFGETLRNDEGAYLPCKSHIRYRRRYRLPPAAREER